MVRQKNRRADLHCPVATENQNHSNHGVCGRAEWSLEKQTLDAAL
jgi:hypothetical protein